MSTPSAPRWPRRRCARGRDGAGPARAPTLSAGAEEIDLRTNLPFQSILQRLSFRADGASDAGLERYKASEVKGNPDFQTDSYRFTGAVRGLYGLLYFVDFAGVRRFVQFYWNCMGTVSLTGSG